MTVCLVLRLAGPLQSWGTQSQFRRRDTAAEPTKSGIVGLLAAALGRRRVDPIEDLVALELGTRVDRRGTLLRDYHTLSDYRGRPLLSVSVGGDGRQKPVSTGSTTAVTRRFYLADAVFVAAIGGAPDVLTALAAAVRRPAFPLALGRRCCPPTVPLMLPTADGSALWDGSPLDVLHTVPWQGGRRRGPGHPDGPLPVIVDDTQGSEQRRDVPTSFAPRDRGFTTRRVRTEWVLLGGTPPADPPHDPFALLGW